MEERGSEYALDFTSHDDEPDCLWQEVETQTWTVDDKPAGTWVSSRNLTYVKVASTTVLLGEAHQPALYRYLTPHTWPGTTNWTQPTT